ncbi:MAG: hemerythrin domain-containing protein [Gammaproteobacteria bacterium]|nr:hemerythrin domain-containing protein [Gammaproteobacteria bacterium]
MLQISSQPKASSDNQENSLFERPLELLLSCHEKIVHFSSALCELSAALQKEGWNDNITASAVQIRHYFNVASTEHHLDEEHHLFPAIIALDPELKNTQSIEIVQLINSMIKEHVESDQLWETLDTLLEEKSEDFAALEELSQRFKTSMHEHARIENEQIFPYARAHISDNDFKKMGLAIAKRRGITPFNLS